MTIHSGQRKEGVQVARKTIYVRGRVKGVDRVLAADLIDDVTAKDLLAQAFDANPSQVTGASSVYSSPQAWFRNAPEKTTVQLRYRVVSN